MPTATPANISPIIAAYALTTADKSRMASLLARAYLTAKAEAYQRAARTAERYVRVKHPWTPDKADATAAQAWAMQQVESIASTYEELLRHAIESATGQERAFGDMAGHIKQVAVAVKEWFRGFLPWKSKQVAGYTQSRGANDGTLKWIDDVTGDDADVEWVDGASADDGHVMVMVEPGESSSDACAAIAGQTYSLLDENLPSPPLHTNCIHYLTIITN